MRRTRPTDTDLFRKLDRYQLAMIEQPLADDGMSLINHADLQRAIETPICLDESAHSLAHVQAAIRLGSCKVVNVKVARVGGLSASRDIQSLCAEHDIPCWIGGMLESAVGGAICAELATLSNFTYAGDIFPSSYFYDNDLGKPEIELSGPGEVRTSAVPGIAQEPDPELLQRWTVAHAGSARSTESRARQCQRHHDDRARQRGGRGVDDVARHEGGGPASEGAKPA